VTAGQQHAEGKARFSDTATLLLSGTTPSTDLSFEVTLYPNHTLPNFADAGIADWLAMLTKWQAWVP